MWSDKHILTPIIMAKEPILKLSGAEYNAAPVKLERKKIYGWTDIVATDRGGEVCGSAYLSPDDALIIPSAREISEAATYSL